MILKKKPKDAAVCERCGEPLWQEVYGPKGEVEGYENDESIDAPGYCSYCGHILTKDD